MAMDRRLPRLPSPHRFLLPGALARLRDSRVLARSLRCAARARPPLPPLSSITSSSPAPPASSWDGAPCFGPPASAARGTVRYPMRKKLAAPRAVAFLPPPEALVDAFPPEAAAPPDVAVAAH